MIRELLSAHTIVGDPDLILFDKIKPLDQADTNSLVFISRDRKDRRELVSRTDAKVILISDVSDITDEQKKEKIFIVLEDPKVAMSKIGNFFFVERVTKHSIHPTAIIDKEAVIAENVTIGPYCVIGKGVIGEGTIIYGHVFIYDNFSIGRNVKINAGTVIGAEGFGYNKDVNGVTVQFPHIGRVIIEDNVEIGANTCVDRGALSDTIIKKDAKIDNLVQVGHNVVVGENTYITSNAMLGGSTEIGSNTYIGPSTTLRDRITIGKDVLVGQHSSVLKAIPDKQTWTGVPAQTLEGAKELNEKLKKL